MPTIFTWVSADSELANWVRQAADAYNARDLESFLALCDPKNEARPLLSQLAGEPYRGHPGIREWWAETFELWDYSPMSIEDVLPAGDSGLALIRIVAQGRSSGAAMELEGGLLFHLRGGLCDRFQVFVDRDEARRAIAAGA